jgi:SnoaL-like protein
VADDSTGVDLEAIRQLKHAYFRLLDTKRFDELGELLTDDVTSSYDSGNMAQEGRAGVTGFLQKVVGDPGLITMHTGHHPEIVLTSESTARGTWYLEDRVIAAAHDFELHGTALYHDEYRKEDGRWRISHTGYDRIFEERRRRSTGEVLSLRSRFDAASGSAAVG